MTIPNHVVTIDHSEYPYLYGGGYGSVPGKSAKFCSVVAQRWDLAYTKGHELGPEDSFYIVFNKLAVDALFQNAILGKQKSVDGEFNKKWGDGIYLVIEYLQEKHTVGRLQYADAESVLVQYNQGVLMVLLCLRSAYNAQKKNKQYARFFNDETCIRSDESLWVKGNLCCHDICVFKLCVNLLPDSGIRLVFKAIISALLLSRYKNL